MSASPALLVLAVLVLASTLVGLLLRRRAATARRGRGAELDDTLVPQEDRGSGGTLVQFSTEFCAQCPGVRRSLTEIAATRPEIGHVEIDLTDRIDLAARLNILQTPTIFVLDAAGAVAARFSGPTPRSAVEDVLNTLPEASHV